MGNRAKSYDFSIVLTTGKAVLLPAKKRCSWDEKMCTAAGGKGEINRGVQRLRDFCSIQRVKKGPSTALVI